jgi:hypothetical protein
MYILKTTISFYRGWRYLIFSQSTFRLGTNAPEGGILDYQYNLGGLETSNDSLSQPLKFNFLRFYQSASFRIKKNVLCWRGLFFRLLLQIEDEKLRLNASHSLITSHYAYNKYYGFEILFLGFKCESDIRHTRQFDQPVQRTFFDAQLARLPEIAWQ